MGNLTGNEVFQVTGTINGRPCGITETVTTQNVANLTNAGGTASVVANVSNLIPSLVLNKYRLALANVRNGTSDARILCAGDSTTAGFGSSSYVSGIPQTNSWPARLASLMNSGVTPAIQSLAVPPSWISANTDNRWSLGSNWGFNFTGNSPYGAGSCAYVGGNAASGTMTFTPSPQVNCDGFYVYRLTTSSGTGTAVATATGGSGVSLVTNTGINTIVRTLVSAGSASTSNTLSIAMTVAGPPGTFIVGIEPVLSTKKQVLVGNAGTGGAQTANWADTTSSAYDGKSFITTAAPDLTIISLGLNDAGASITPAAFQTNMQSLITSAKISGDVLLCDFPPTNPAAFATTAAQEKLYLPIYQALSVANNCAYLSFYGRLGSAYNAPYMYTDGLHANDQGYWDWAQFMSDVIANP